MQIGDLVKHRHIPSHPAEYLKDWLGIVVNFDKDGDPCVHWYDKGVELYDQPTWEFMTAVEKI